MKFKLGSNPDHFLTQIIYLTFAFDSLLKISIGFQIHVGILLTLSYNIIFLLFGKWGGYLNVFKTNKILLLFLTYALISGIVNVGISSIKIFIYLFLMMNCYLFFAVHSRKLRYTTVVRFQQIMIITGLFQFIAYKIFGWQINFLDTEHYNTVQSYAHRLRGFFIEPNWFAIAFAFNTLLLIGNDLKSVWKKHRLLLLFSGFVFLLNGSFGPLSILFLVVAWGFFKNSKVTGIVISVLSVSLILTIFSYRGKIQGREGVNVLNYYSRLTPIIRLIDYWESVDMAKIITGHGLGSWGTLAIREDLSVLVYEENPTKRDASELPVFLFEFGLLGTFIFFLDSLLLYRKCNSYDIVGKGAIILFLIIFLLYPAFKFWMYMAYYFVLRQNINNKSNKDVYSIL
ncbi:hypothetical protein [Carboxylicivirga marina]|uniref:hypothetical protein n=1 Tax=Carboxylicivirga marina TaxID=2800988 RepID=UPI002598F061|nr:hypothetical protein [uncultured Carboxylicivirga sp.]